MWAFLRLKYMQEESKSEENKFDAYLYSEFVTVIFDILEQINSPPGESGELKNN
jgi:hypothetical protein